MNYPSEDRRPREACLWQGTGGGCSPILKSSALIVTSVVPAKAETQGFQSLAPLFTPGAGPGSPLARGRRVCASGGYPDSVESGALGATAAASRSWIPAFARMMFQVGL